MGGAGVVCWLRAQATDLLSRAKNKKCRPLRVGVVVYVQHGTQRRGVWYPGCKVHVSRYHGLEGYLFFFFKKHATIEVARFGFFFF